jgi:phage-related protein
MPTQSPIATGIVVWASKGFAALQAQLGQVQTKLKATQEGFAKLGGTRVFAAMTAGIGGLLAVADPVRFRAFTASLQILSLQIGRIFIPLLKDATRWVDQLAAYFRGLSDQQREQVLHWTKIALAGAAFVMVATKIVGVMSMVSGVLPVLSAAVKGVGMAFSSLGKGTGPIAAVLLVVGLIATVLSIVEAKTGLISKLFDKWGDVLGPLKPFMDQIAEAAGGLFQKMVPALKMVAGSVMTLIEAVAPAYQAMGKVYADLIMPFLKIIGVILPLYMKFQAVILMVVAKILTVVAAVVTPIAELFDRLWKAAEEGLAPVGEAFQKLWELVKPIFDQWQGVFDEIMDILVTGLTDSIKMAQDLCQFILTAVQTLARNILAILQSVKAARKELLEGTAVGRGAKWLGEKTGLMDKEGNGILEKPLEKILGGIADFKLPEGRTKDKLGKDKKGKDDFSPKAVQQAPQFVAISEQFKKVQQAAIEDPSKKLEAERTRLAKSSDEHLADISKNTKSMDSGGLAF